MHTKGPWKVKEVVTSVGRAFKINEPAKIDDDHGCIACIYDDSTSLNLRPSEEHEANARLIAAAPELLDACELAFANLKPQGDIQKDFDGHVTMAAIGKAVHKAKGE